MEIKTELKYPYSEEKRLDFIVEQNHKNGYEIREVQTQFNIPDLQAWGYTAEEIAEQEAQAEIERKKKLRMTKRDFYLYVVYPFNIPYTAMLEAIKAIDLVYACYDGCEYIYRYDEVLMQNIKPLLEQLSGTQIDEQQLNTMLDTVFAEHTVK